MRRLAVALALLAISLAPTTVRAGPRAVGAQPVATGLNFPAAFTFAPDGRIFYGELDTGEIRIFDPDTTSDTLFFDVPNIMSDGERGLLGLALHPNYPGKPFVYAYATRNPTGTPRNQILRLTDVGGSGTDLKVVFTSDTTSQINHNGGRILFGPDKKLYVLIGDALSPGHSQNLDVDAGKILRMNANGTVPRNNPFPGSRVFAYGIRNAFGFTFDPITGLLWETENGPACNDEVNSIEAGENYGWGPSQTCATPPPPPENTNQDGPDPHLPEVWFTPTIAPTGAAFCRDCGLVSGNVKLFFGAVNTGEIRRAKMTGDRMGIVSVAVVYDHPAGILSMEVGPDDAIYFSEAGGIYRLVEV